jgi:eukaryotic-like serine/threonine-protein kinase
MRDDPGTLGADREPGSPEEQSRAELGSTNEYRAAALWPAADRLVCPSCHHTLESGDLHGSSIHCEQCGGSFRLEKLAQTSTIDAIRVIGRFQLLDAVGKGAFGTVWRARDTQLDRVVALKIPHPHAIESWLDAERLGREARIAAQLRHEGIVRLYEMLTLENVPVLVSDFIDGLSLKDFLKIRRMTFHETALVVAQIAESLDYAHECGLIHRDIKPANIMIEYGAGGDLANGASEKPGAHRVGKPIIVDFGLALRPETEIVMTVEGQLLGTPAYMSPEQAAGHAHRVDRRSDIYSLGVMMYELLCGELPFRGSKLMVLHQVQYEDPRPPRLVNDRIPRDLETICLKALAKVPSRRYATAGELALDLRRYLRGEPCRARPVGRLERLWLWARRNTALAAAVTAASFALVAVAVSALLMAAHERRHAHELGIRMAENYLDRGQSLCEGGEVAHGMLLMAEGLEAVPSEARELRRVLSTNLAAWHEQIDPLLAVQNGGGRITAVAFSPDGKLAATGGNALAVHLWDGSGAQPLAEPIVCPDAVRSLVFSPDSHVLAIVCRNGRLLTWDTRAHQLLPAPFVPSEGANSIAFSHDGKTVAVEGANHRVRLYSTELGTRPPRELDQKQRITMIAFAPDDKTIVTVTLNGVIQLWDTKDGARRPVSAVHPGLLRSADLSRDGRWLATGGDEHFARIWDAASLKLVQVLPHANSVGAVAFSPDGHTLLTGCADKIGRLWDVRRGELIGPVAFHRQALSAVQFSPDGRRMLTCDTDGFIQFRQCKSALPRCLEIAHRSSVAIVGFSPDSRLAISGTKPPDKTESEVQVWDVSTGKSLAKVAHSGIVNAAIFSPTGQTFATASADHTSLLVDVSSGKILCPPMSHPGWVHAIAINPTGTRLLTGCDDGNARLWEVPTGRYLNRQFAHGEEVSAVAFSPSGALALTAGADGTAKLWDVASGQQRHVFRHRALVRKVAFSPDGKIVLTASSDGTARLWDVESGQPLGEPLRHQDEVDSAAFSPGGDTVLTGSKDKTAQLWRVAPPVRFGPALTHQERVLVVAYSPDRLTVATGSGDATARLWNVATGRPLGPVLRHRETVADLAFSPDGHCLITGSSDHTARIWVLPHALESSPQRLAVWVQTLSGMELTSNGAISVLSREDWEKRRQQLEKLGGPPVAER